MYEWDYFDARQEHEDSQPSSMSELVREQASYDGHFVPEVKWLLSDFDTWERNPHYRNPKPWLVDDSHPDDDAPRPICLRVVQCDAFRVARAALHDSDLPF